MNYLLEIIIIVVNRHHDHKTLSSLRRQHDNVSQSADICVKMIFICNFYEIKMFKSFPSIFPCNWFRRFHGIEFTTEENLSGKSAIIMISI